VTEYEAQADFTACIAMGLKHEWQGGLSLVDTPSGAIHAQGLHMPQTRSRTSGSPLAF